jgi:hypothetical protein
MILIIVAVVVLAVVALPQLLVRTTIRRHGAERPDLPGTGGELARHLLDRFELAHVRVEVTEKGDHYDPDAGAVRLLPQHHDGRSLSAVAIAAHEVSHAIQHGNGERKLALRQRLARVAQFTDRIAGVFFLAAPVLTVIIRSPAALAGAIAIGVALLSVRVVVNLVTLPVETDASFAKALPILKDGGYLSERDLPAARSILRAAAFTYVAGALISLINLARWIRLLR